MNRQGWIIAAAIVAAVAVGVAFYFLRGGQDGDTVPPITGAERAEEGRGVLEELQRERAERERAAAQAGAQPARAPAGAPPAAARAADAEVGPASPTPPAAAASAVTAPATELDTAFARAQAFRAEGQLADAQVLYFFAARSGHGGAAFELGTMNDPLHHKPETSFLPEPDAFQAYRWYTAARGAGVAEAIARLAALRTWATAEAAKGNAEAERLLLQWE